MLLLTVCAEENILLPRSKLPMVWTEDNIDWLLFAACSVPLAASSLACRFCSILFFAIGPMGQIHKHPTTAPMPKLVGIWILKRDKNSRKLGELVVVAIDHHTSQKNYPPPIYYHKLLPGSA